MTGRPARRGAWPWVYVSAASSPIGGGLIKLGRGSTWAAVAVSTAPYVLCGLLILVFVIGYLAALARYLWAKPEDRLSMERLITVSANAVVSILTLSNVGTMPRKASPPEG